MLYLRACPKCETGAVRLSADWDVEYFQCLNCGYTLYIRPAVTSVKSLGSEQQITDGEGVAA